MTAYGRMQFTEMSAIERKHIKDALLLHEFSIEAICFTVDHHRLGEELGILFKSDEEKLQELRRIVYPYLREKFGMNFDEQYSFSSFELPLNANGKTDRRKAQELWYSLANKT